jgi:hypothetical protein
MGLVPRQAIGGHDHHGIECPTLGGVPQAVQRRPVEAAATDAFIEIGVLGQEAPPLLRDVLVECLEL